MRNFRDLKVWQNGMQIVKEVYLLANTLPNIERFGLTSQITRAAVSVPSNIAEGSSRSSDKDFGRFLEISLGSLFEIETQLHIIKELGWVDENSRFESLMNSIIENQKMLTSFIQKAKPGF